MKLTLKETKKAIKNNQTVKFTLERNNARELTSNKKYYKRYVKAIVKTVKSFYPALDSYYILSELERYEILPNVSRFDEEGYLIRYGKQRYVTAQTFEVSDFKNAELKIREDDWAIILTDSNTIIEEVPTDYEEDEDEEDDWFEDEEE